MSPEFVRTIDPKGRLALPACIAEGFDAGARITLRGDGFLEVRSSQQGRRVTRVNPQGPGRWRTRRLVVPAEFRHRLGILPGVDVGLARAGEMLFVWPLLAGDGGGRGR